MDRFFLAREHWATDVLLLEGEEGHHAVRVMRKKQGDGIELFDGQGRWARCEIVEVTKNTLHLERKEEGVSHQVRPQVNLLVAIPKGKTMDLVVQKAVELGVNSIQPLITAHTIVKLDSKERAEKTMKWQRVALEACKQCGQNFLPQVAPVTELSDYLTQMERGDDARVIASLAPNAGPVREVLEQLPSQQEQLSLLVGPEGDFTQEEVSAALAGGFVPVSQ